ncbi:hypothetical protein TNCT_270811 [Trichonephila clavata]|uniref:Uncharacterized protein n=1 Tax=Trichonephila clavata TaxID=2740835 RepID=A0A8X6HE14_TRICU|nr:hypothetical protein TNCT_270811 [Trichonephila clavata]
MDSTGGVPPCFQIGGGRVLSRGLTESSSSSKGLVRRTARRPAPRRATESRPANASTVATKHPIVVKRDTSPLQRP